MSKAVRIILTALLAVAVAFPVAYALSASFFSPVDFSDTVAHFLPSSLSFGNYRIALANRWYPRYVLNSLLTAGLSCLLRFLVTIPAAFAFTHLRFKGQRALLTLLLATMFVPSEALLYENYLTIARLGLMNTYAAIILPSIFSAATLVLLIGTYKVLGTELYDAAKVDGAGDFRYISLILLPLSSSVTLTLALQAFITSFNSYLWPLLVTSKQKMRTVQVGISMLGFAESGQYGAQYAAIVIITLPFLVLLGLGRRMISKTVSRDLLG